MKTYTLKSPTVEPQKAAASDSAPEPAIGLKWVAGDFFGGVVP